MIDDNKVVTFNKFQALSHTVRAHREYHVVPRGGGKSTGIIAPRIIYNFNTFPKVTGITLGPTFISLLQKTLPTVLEGFAMIGWFEDEDYVIGRKPPEKWDKPHVYPRRYDYFLSTRKGAGLHLISQDRKNTSNGLSSGFIIGDEAKLLKKDMIDEESAQTLRGMEKYYGDHPMLYNQMFVTDQPTSPRTRWIHEFAHESIDNDTLTLIINLQVRYNRLEEKYLTLSDKNKKKKVEYLMASLELQLLELRRNSVFYYEPEIDDVIRALGPRFIQEQKRILPDYIFYTSILNMKSPLVENGFYGNFNSNQHTYTAINYEYIDSLEYNLLRLSEMEPWKKDADIDPKKPLSIALDYNAAINNLVVGQRTDKMRVLNHIYSLWPQLLPHCVEQFCKYYRNYPNRNIVYWFDHTALQGKNAVSNIVFKDEVIDVLQKNGWKVIPKYMGQTPSHESRYLFINKVFSQAEPGQPPIMINSENCPSLITAIESAEVKQGKNGFEKQKKYEADTSLDQSTTTHVTDAFDTLIYGELKMSEIISNTSGTLDTVFR